MDGCTAAAYAAYAFSDVATVYPITPVAEMGDTAGRWASGGIKNLFGQTMVVITHDEEIALAAELITEGSLNVFAHPGNVNMDSRIVVLDLYEMGEQLRPTALVVTLEAIQNRVMENRKRGKYTWVFLDEVYLYFKYHYSGEFLYRAWKRSESTPHP